MRMLTRADAEYDEARQLFNCAIDRRPAVIAPCASPKDIREALTHSADNSLAVAVRAGGHSVSGLSTNDGGMVIDVRPMKTIELNHERRTVRVGAGVTWGEFDAAAEEHGLAVTGGRATSTGVAGFTLGGGERDHDDRRGE